MKHLESVTVAGSNDPVLSESPDRDFHRNPLPDDMSGNMSVISISSAGGNHIISTDALVFLYQARPSGWNSLTFAIWLPHPPINGLLKIPIEPDCIF